MVSEKCTLMEVVRQANQEASRRAETNLKSAGTEEDERDVFVRPFEAYGHTPLPFPERPVEEARGW